MKVGRAISKKHSKGQGVPIGKLDSNPSILKYKLIYFFGVVAFYADAEFYLTLGPLCLNDAAYCIRKKASMVMVGDKFLKRTAEHPPQD